MSYRYRIYPSRSQSTRLRNSLDLCRELYNAALQERRDVYRHSGVLLSCRDQRSQLPYIKEVRPEFYDICAQVLQDVIIRLDRAFMNFFMRLRRGENPGYPRFRGRSQYKSITYPQYKKGFSVFGGCVRLHKFGSIQMKIHRPIDGIMKTCTISQSSSGKWFASFSCEVGNKPLPKSTESIGIDVGLRSFAVLSDGETIPNPRFFHEYEKRLAKSQRLMEKQPKGSFERSRRRKVVSHIHEKISNLRSDFVHKRSREIVSQYGIICIENLAIRRMIRDKRYSKRIQDAAWGQFAFCLSYKAANAGRIAIASDPSYTSQTCNRCRSLNHEFIGRMFHCLDCDNLIDRDRNAAINIERLGLQSLGLSQEALG